MDPEQTFIRVQERFSQMLRPKARAALEYFYLFVAITLFSILVVMHANYVQQPGCSSELYGSGVEFTEAQLIQIKITSAGLWSQNESESNAIDVPDVKTVTEKLEVANVDGDGLTFLAAKFWLNWIGSGARRDKLAWKFWKTDNELVEQQAEPSVSSQSPKPTVDDAVTKIDKEERRSSFPVSARETFKAAIFHFGKKWYKRLLFIWRHAMQVIRSFSKLWNLAGIHLNIDTPKLWHILQLDRLSSYAVQWLEKRSKAFEPTYIYTIEKGYFLLPEGAKSRHNIRTVNISMSARHSCFGNRWQQLLINRIVGYDTILMNSLLTSPGQGYLFNYQTKEFYNLSYPQEPPGGPARFGDYLVTKCGVLMMSLFVFFTTTMSVSFTLRETQTRMLKFTVQLQHHARHRLPTFQLIFVHVIESLVFVPIMIGILFFLFEFYDDQLLAFMVLILVWLSELFTLISVRTPISMKFFPRFFLLYFLVFHIYFFSYPFGFSYLALSTAAAFMQHLILYFWNRFEVPALQRFMQNRRSQLQQHPDFHITSSTILASTLHITRLNTRQRLPTCVELEKEGMKFRHEPSWELSFSPSFTDSKYMNATSKPRVAVIREEGSNGDREMSAAFYAAGFEPWDVTMSDLLKGTISLQEFRGIVFVGGFSYADVLDSAKGWSASIRFNQPLLNQFQEFYKRPDTFSLGICNGCQLMALLGWVPGPQIGGVLGAGGDSSQPRFIHNESGRFECRFTSVSIKDSPAVMFKGMEGSTLGVWAAHGEGRAFFPDDGVLDHVLHRDLAPLRYCDDDGNVTETYPFNLNGSPLGVAAICSPDGRHLAMMPHPERCFLMWQFPWYPKQWNVDKKGPSPWLRMFQNAREWCS